MSDAANSSIPLEIRQQFPCDDHGRVLWFTTPPLNNAPGPLEIVPKKDGKPLAHTPEYFAAKEKRRKMIEERKREVQERMAAEKGSADAEENGLDSKRQKVTDPQVDTLVLQTLTDQILNANKEWYQAQYGDRAAEVEAFDAQRVRERRKEGEAQEAYFEERRRVEEQRREREKGMEGRVFRDDWDERH
jgi:chromatin structure-remodeling complex subunit RSC1/2